MTSRKQQRRDAPTNQGAIDVVPSTWPTIHQKRIMLLTRLARRLPVRIRCLSLRRRLNGFCQAPVENGLERKVIAMQRASRFIFGLSLLTCVMGPACAESIDVLRGQFAFDWHTEPDKTKCAAVDDSELTIFKSDAYQCNLDVVTNTASSEPARVCTEKGDGAEYLIFASMKACELERTTQASNSE